jgi:hypothetical protein
LFFDRRLGMPMRVGSRGTARPEMAAHFSGEPEALSGEFFPFPLIFLLGIFCAMGKTG